MINLKVLYETKSVFLSIYFLVLLFNIYNLQRQTIYCTSILKYITVADKHPVQFQWGSPAESHTRKSTRNPAFPPKSIKLNENTYNANLKTKKNSLKTNFYEKI